MDITNRNVQTQSVPGASAATGGGSGKRKNHEKGLLGRIGVVAIVAAVVILLVAVIAVLMAGPDENNTESNHVDTSKLQAVFLNTGQVYFGNVTTMNEDFYVLTNIYYLQTTGDANAQNPNITLVKLGCELHEPYDKMVINRDQVTFWENLQDNGQVAKAVSTFKEQNPEGQKCADQSSSSSTNSSDQVQSAGNNEDSGDNQ